VLVKARGYRGSISACPDEEKTPFREAFQGANGAPSQARGKTSLYALGLPACTPGKFGRSISEGKLHPISFAC
jgi:hypothetical protein